MLMTYLGIENNWKPDLPQVLITFTTGGSETPSLYDIKGKLH